MRITQSKTRQRRSHHGAVEPRLSKDHESGELSLRHRAAPSTGRYRGRMVVDVAAKLAKQEKKRKRREVEAARTGERVKTKDEDAPDAPDEPRTTER